jgi:predicted Zn-dependent peptidase
LKDLSFLLISTQVGANHTEATLHEIKREIKRLRSEAVPDGELELVKNYTAGTLLRSFDGTFNQASLLKTMHLHELPEAYYTEFLRKIYAVNSDDIMRMAKTYFDPDKFTIAVVGEGFSDND